MISCRPVLWRVTCAALFLPLLITWRLTAQDRQSLEKQLQTDFVDKVVTLRRPDCSDRIRFGSNGMLIGKIKDGSWTLCSRMIVRELRLKPGELTVEGRRLWVAFNPNMDLLDSGKGIRIEYKSLPDSADLRALHRLLASALLTEGDPLLDTPEAWKPYLSGGLKTTPKDSWQVLSALCGAEKVISKQDDPTLKVPELLNRREPRYSEPARKARLQGTVVLIVRVMSDGKVCGPTIYRPLGLGLDEEALRAVGEWRFRPGMKDGKPVPVTATIEVTFRMK